LVSISLLARLTGNGKRFACLAWFLFVQLLLDAVGWDPLDHEEDLKLFLIPVPSILF
jgi:hypothetical protein